MGEGADSLPACTALHARTLIIILLSSSLLSSSPPPPPHPSSLSSPLSPSYKNIAPWPCNVTTFAFWKHCFCPTISGGGGGGGGRQVEVEEAGRWRGGGAEGEEEGT